MISKIKIWQKTLIIGLTMLLPFSEAAAADDTQQLFQVVCSDNQHERTITWQSGSAHPEAFVEYQQLGAADLRKQPSENTLLTAPGNQVYMHTVKLKKLLPGTAYRYRIGSGTGEFSQWQEFKTDNGDAFTALIFSDTQCENYGVWQKTAEQAKRQFPQADLFIDNGDLVDNGEAWYQWQSWLDGGRELFQSMVFAPVSGNHENYDMNWQNTPAHVYRQLFALPLNGAPGYQKQSYSFDYGPVHFAVIDTQLNELKQWQPALLTEQAEWLDNDLAASQAPWKIVLMHRNIFDYGLPDSPLDNRDKLFMPIIDRHNVDVVFTAHIHSYRRTYSLKNRQLDEHGTVYISTGCAGDQTWGEFAKLPYEAAANPQPGIPNYLVMQADAEKIRLQAFTQTGELLDLVDLEKASVLQREQPVAAVRPAVPKHLMNSEKGRENKEITLQKH